MKKRNTYDDQFKARVALEAVKGEKTVVNMGYIAIRFVSGKSIC